MTYAGIDISLTRTGVCLVSPNEIPSSVLALPLSYPMMRAQTAGGHVVAFCIVPTEGASMLQRWCEIADVVLMAAHLAHSICIEGYSFGSHMAHGRAIAEIGGIVRYVLGRHRIAYRDIPPTSLKKFISNAGNAKKDQMLLQTYKRYGVEFSDDNMCDAYGLAKIGEAIRWIETNDPNGMDLTSWQADTVQALLHPKAKTKKSKKVTAD